MELKVGQLRKGKYNNICDVDEVEVGHYTITEGDIQTGVTAIIPKRSNMFDEKLLASTHIINGFGKSVGLMQVEELGTIESPILLTNTHCVGRVSSGLVQYMLNSNSDIGSTTSSVNPIVLECNDGYLNDIRKLSIKEEDVIASIKSSKKEFSQGAIGAGRGMSCYSLKGGIGSSSRIIMLDNEEYTVGVLVLSNFGKGEDLIFNGMYIGDKVAKIINEKALKENGSIIIVIATNVPLSNRQLKRVAKRATIGLARTGSHLGNGSGDVVIAFSTANIIDHYNNSDISTICVISDNVIDKVFKGVIEATEEAVLNSLIHAQTLKGKDGNVRYSLLDLKVL